MTGSSTAAVARLAGEDVVLDCGSFMHCQDKLPACAHTSLPPRPYLRNSSALECSSCRFMFRSYASNEEGLMHPQRHSAMQPCAVPIIHMSGPDAPGCRAKCEIGRDICQSQHQARELQFSSQRRAQGSFTDLGAPLGRPRTDPRLIKTLPGLTSLSRRQGEATRWPSR